MMKECLFKSGLEGPLFNAPPLHHMHAHTCSLADIRTHVCTFIHTYNFVVEPYVLVHPRPHYMVQPHPKICNTTCTNVRLTVIQSSRHNLSPWKLR